LIFEKAFVFVASIEDGKRYNVEYRCSISGIMDETVSFTIKEFE
jgi:hypothetical protein